MRCIKTGVLAIVTPLVLATAGVAHAATVTLAWNPTSGASGYIVSWGNISHVYTASRDVGNQTIAQISGLVDGAPYYFSVQAYNSGGRSPYSTEVSRRVGVPYSVQGDYNRDRRADMSIFRRTTGQWFLRGVGDVVYGGGSDVPVPRDYDGDGVMDVAVFRPSGGNWYVRASSTGLTLTGAWGGPGDVPVPGDYNGDGRADFAVFRPATGMWYIRGVGDVRYGGGTDIPVPVDFDGDGRSDVAVFRPSTGRWYIIQSNTWAGAELLWGTTGDLPVAADYDGDGKADVAIFRPSTGEWFLRYSTTGATGRVVWGGAGDVAVPADFDGDGLSDVAVYRPSNGTWYVRNSGGSIVQLLFGGLSTDLPVVK